MADILTAMEGATSLEQQVTNTAASVGDTLLLTLTIGLIVLALGGLGFYLWWINSFKITIKIMEVITKNTGDKGQFVVFHDKAKRKKQGGGEFWKLKRRRALVLAPPHECIQITGRGRYYAECLHWEKSGLDAGYKWISPNIKMDDFQVKNDFKLTLSQEERTVLSDRIRRSEARKSKSVLDYIVQIAGMTLAIIIVVSLMAFYGEITKNVKETSAAVDNSIYQVGELMKQQSLFQQELTRTYHAISGEKITNLSTEIPLAAQVGATT
jgi:hypothetical protein